MTSTAETIFTETEGLRGELSHDFGPIFDALLAFTKRQASSTEASAITSKATELAAATAKSAEAALQSLPIASLKEAVAAAGAAARGTDVKTLATVAAAVLLTSALLALTRGASIEVSALDALDDILLKGALLVDIRSASDAAARGVVLPGRATRSLVSAPLDAGELGVERGKIRDAKRVELALWALKVANLKAVSGRTLYLLGANGRDAVAAAGALSRAGIRSVRVVAGGYQSWERSSLPVQSTASRESARTAVPVRAEVLSAEKPARAPPQPRRLNLIQAAAVEVEALPKAQPRLPAAAKGLSKDKVNMPQIARQGTTVASRGVIKKTTSSGRP